MLPDGLKCLFLNANKRVGYVGEGNAKIVSLGYSDLRALLDFYKSLIVHSNAFPVKEYYAHFILTCNKHACLGFLVLLLFSSPFQHSEGKVLLPMGECL